MTTHIPPPHEFITEPTIRVHARPDGSRVLDVEVDGKSSLFNLTVSDQAEVSP